MASPSDQSLSVEGVAAGYVPQRFSSLHVGFAGCLEWCCFLGGQWPLKGSSHFYLLYHAAHRGILLQSEIGETPHDEDKTNRHRGWALCGDMVGVPRLI